MYCGSCRNLQRAKLKIVIFIFPITQFQFEIFQGLIILYEMNPGNYYRELIHALALADSHLKRYGI